jgi:cell division septal protein FtsQ
VLQKVPKIYLPTPKPKKQFKFPWPLVKFIFFVGIMLVLGYLLFFSPYFIIKNVEVKGSQNPKVIELLQVAKGKNLWLLNKNILKKELSGFAEIQSISIKKRPPSTLKVEIVEKPEGIIWRTQEKRYLLDNTGTVIKEVTEGNLPEIIDPKNASVDIGKQIVTPVFVNFVKNLVFEFTPKTNLTIKEISVLDEMAVDIAVQTESIKAIFDTQGDLDNQLENMAKVYQAKKDDIKEYMDLRIEGRVYYK